METWKIRINKLKENRLCVRCMIYLDEDDGFLCKNCSYKNNIKNTFYRNKLKENRLCEKCKKHLTNNDGVLCESCNIKNINKMLNRRSALNAGRFCESCTNKLEKSNGIFCKKCAARRAAKMVVRRNKLKEERRCVECSIKLEMNNKKVRCKACSDKLVKYEKLRRKTDIAFRIMKNISKSINYMLKNHNSNKKGKSKNQYLLFTKKQLMQYIENIFEFWMTWKNYGGYNLNTWKDDDISTWKWSLDHIIPQSQLPFSSFDDENYKKCWALENLRPYSAKQNTLDGSRK